MKLRERKITVRLTDAERDHLLTQAELAGLKIEPFVRNVILGVQMQPGLKRNGRSCCGRPPALRTTSTRSPSALTLVSR